MHNEVKALRELEKVIQKHCALLGYSSKREDLYKALDAVATARVKDEAGCDYSQLSLNLES